MKFIFKLSGSDKQFPAQSLEEAFEIIKKFNHTYYNDYTTMSLKQFKTLLDSKKIGQYYSYNNYGWCVVTEKIFNAAYEMSAHSKIPKVVDNYIDKLLK